MILCFRIPSPANLPEKLCAYNGNARLPETANGWHGFGLINGRPLDPFPLGELLADRKVSLELTAQARELLFKEGYDPAYGARPLRRALQQLIQDRLALKMLDGEVLPGDHVVADADLDRGQLVFERAANAKQAVN